MAVTPSRPRGRRKPKMLPDGVDPHGLRDTIIAICVLMAIYVALLLR